MRILGIETSCDETSVSVVEDGVKILSNVVATSLAIHASTGGIIPENAAREQLKYIIPVIDEAIKLAASSKRLGAKKEGLSANRSPLAPKIDAIAVTYGPGLIGSLLVGVEAAKTLAYVWQKPIVPINHLVAHLYANWLSDGNTQNATSNTKPEFPALGLLVSGGHTDLVIMKGHGEIEWIGGTRDDAAGECFDKSARVLGLPYPGGPSISAAAEKFQITSSKSQIKLPRPMMFDKNFDFSFSGLKTAVINEASRLNISHQSHFPPLHPTSHVSPLISNFAYEIQEAITDVLVYKTMKAAEKFKVKSILLAGGVSANRRLKEKMESAISNTPYALHIPAPKLCTDNAAYIAGCGFFNFKPVPWQTISANPSLSIEE